jgi:hypothetical protein
MASRFVNREPAPLLIAIDPVGNLELAIWIGAGGGSLLGVMGGIIGAVAGTRQARINRRLTHFSASGEP